MNDPWAALQRDCLGAFDATFDEATVKNLYGMQLSQLENFLKQHKVAQTKLKQQLQEAEQRCEKVCIAVVLRAFLHCGFNCCSFLFPKNETRGFKRAPHLKFLSRCSLGLVEALPLKTMFQFCSQGWRPKHFKFICVKCKVFNHFLR